MNFLTKLNKIYFLVLLFIVYCVKPSYKKVELPKIEVDKEKRTIIFEATLNITKNEKYFLFYFQGYPWIKDYCLFVSSSSLKELQSSIALIDWQLWDKIYTTKFPPKLEIEIFEDNKWLPLSKFINLKNFNTFQTIFWGSPIYDEVVLKDTYKTTICANCELLPLEQSVVLSGVVPLEYKLKNNFKSSKMQIRIKFK
ncbi:MAG: hypothetical protein RMJ67_03750 [Elusimicrobiota bacterium]|nr:hypothetical protein [Endomicrobiia bacterium]MDW8165606.1 hypothetical protein [Elusimicrobiota bacterium]